jgi:hypothetical protein
MLLSQALHTYLYAADLLLSSIACQLQKSGGVIARSLGTDFAAD